MFGALAIAEMAAAFPKAVGIYVYLREAYCPSVAFLFGWTLFLVVDSGSLATLAVAFSTKYLPTIIPSLATTGAAGSWTCKIISLVFIAFLAAVN